MGSELGRMMAVARLSFRGTLQGTRLVGLGAFAMVPSLILLALLSAHASGPTLTDATEQLYTALTLPVVLLLIILVVGVALFRSEIDADTLLYLSDRSITRPTLVVGKYLGGTAASLVLAIPATALPLGVAIAGGAALFPLAVSGAMLGTTVLAVLCYGAFFLYLGLISRSALIIGLLYGILWEELLPLLPGDLPRLTIIYYLHTLLAESVRSGPFSGGPTAIPFALALLALLATAGAFVVLGGVTFRYVETAPERESG